MTIRRATIKGASFMKEKDTDNMEAETQTDLTSDITSEDRAVLKERSSTLKNQS